MSDGSNVSEGATAEDGWLEEELYHGAVGTFLRTAHRRAEQPFASSRASPALLGFCGDALWLCTCCVSRVSGYIQLHCGRQELAGALMDECVAANEVGCCDGYCVAGPAAWCVCVMGRSRSAPPLRLTAPT